MRTLEEVKAESTCQKRVTICEIFDKEGNLLSRESNRCSPDGGICHRLEVNQGKDNYDVNSQCNWHHAEQRAVSLLPIGSNAYRSVLYGHSFYCDACESALRGSGVEILDIA